MDILSFDSPEEMARYIQRANATANRNLHPLQRALTFGDCWVRFVDLDNKHIEFGRIYTPDEIVAAARTGGATKGEGVEQAREAESDLEAGLMYGIAFSIQNPEGEVGYTHKANAWPVERVVFEEADEVEGRLDDMALWARISLSIAHAGWTAHQGSQA